MGTIYPRIAAILAVIALACLVRPATGQLFVTNYKQGTVGEYDPATGQAINASFISGLKTPTGIAADNDGRLYVATNGAIKEYDYRTGAVINDSFIPDVTGVLGIELDGLGNLYTTNFNGPVGKYNATTGAAINSRLFSSVHPYDVALDGNGHVFVSTYTINTVGEYDANTGELINRNFVQMGTNGRTGLEDPLGLAFDGRGHLFVTNSSGESTVTVYDASTGAVLDNQFIFFGFGGTGIAVDPDDNLYVSVGFSNAKIGKFNALTGAAVQTPFITGLNDNAGYIALVVPEPASAGLLAIGMAGLMGRRSHRRIEQD